MLDYWGNFVPDVQEDYSLSERDQKEVALMKKYENQDMSDEEWDRLCEMEVYGREPRLPKPIVKNRIYKDEPKKTVSNTQKSMLELLHTLSPEAQNRLRELVKG